MFLSIIVPVYNVEKYIYACIQSIFQQDMNDSDFELILVDDGTPDNSFEKIDEFLQTHNNIHIIRQTNAGLSVARNTGLKSAKGDYVMFVDSDDLLIKAQLPTIINKAIQDKPDLLITQFIKLTDDQIKQWSPDSSPAYEFRTKSGEAVFIEDLNPQQCYIWRTIYNREFLLRNNIQFIPGIYFEDVPFTVECYLHAKKCIMTSAMTYIYRQRAGSIVSTINKQKLIHMNQVIEYLWNMMQNNSYSPEINQKLMDVIFGTFSICIWYLTHHKEMPSYRKEIITDLHHRIPQLEFTHGYKQRLVSFLFRYMPDTYIYLRSLGAKQLFK